MTLTHRQTVTRLYRHSLKHMLSWIVQRELFNVEAQGIRDAFRAGAQETDPKKIKQLVADGHRLLASKSHPDLYILPAAIGGSKYMRNPAPFHDVVHHHQ
ncbi:mitochondrial Complex I (CI) NADH:ubiquinone oxidoreductase subunit B22/NI2M/NDUFB9 [Andalucia godoyi]|uniref:NADH dehydrogenase [ubiquinone] 1 beta subcomplex subunit 9 n=1 Tax=Andalucia godoyi TaxID=505711 RepID=A0A8K0AHZ6_ANDGO|nr:mitochondrial Complex I (CI) NADH:ubiquinone oxidoreductase subunit B22/NI2M/NDUFB9 [Andalucia godoyi]|eukprot:ANDGO_07605.mRNA.1 mitochondrial Complex I (CI) NADH:ubiquinone oxidoreductase subunit B22/NI2M/NDUFB9